MPIVDIKTATEAKADALVQQQLDAAPDSIGGKIKATLGILMDFQKSNPSALEVNVSANNPVIIPTGAIAPIQATWGYIITAVPIPVPNGYTGNINNWSRITKVSWDI